MAKKKNNEIWNILSSLRLTLILLVILAGASVVGSFVTGIGVYHSIWFRTIISLLAVNLIICSINRFPGILKRYRLLPKPDRQRPFKDLPPERILTLEGSDADISEKISNLVKNKYKRTEKKDTSNGTFFYGEKGRYSLFGVYLVHLSVLFILVGAIIGSISGFNAYVQIPEGGETDTVLLQGGENHKHKKLDFIVRCENFFVDFYNEGTPKEYRTEITFKVDGEIAHKGDLFVNHPINFRGIRFYLSSYGEIPGDSIQLKILKDNIASEKGNIAIKKGQRLPIGENGEELQLIEIEANLKGMMGPAALISIIHQNAEKNRFWVLQDYDRLKKMFPPEMFKAPILNPSSFKPYTFILDSISKKYYTGLQVNKDPGIPFVWTGFILIIIGLFITFFQSHRRIWILMTQTGMDIEIRVSGMANKNPVGMERELDQLTELIREHVFTGRQGK